MRPRLLVVALVVAIAVAVAFAPAREPSSALSGAKAPAARRPAKAVTVSEVIAREFGALAPCFRAIAWRESRNRPDATNWSDVHSDGSRGSFGLFQIGAVHRGRLSVAAFRRRMLDARANARMAHRLYRADGLAPWGGRC